MKHLILFRHAKSDWTTGSENDHDRPLAKRGRKAAVLMGRFLALSDQVPQTILCSSSRRTLETAERAAEAGRWGCEITVVPALYESGPETVLATIRQVADGIERLMIVGHEPACSSTLSLLAGDGRSRFPTAAMARIDLEAGSWRETGPGGGTLVWLVTPKLLGTIGFSRD